MRDSGRQKFEEAWQQAFMDAEAEPSKHVWANVDAQLSRVEGVLMKQRVVFYQRLAAASVLFALLCGGLVWYSLRDNTVQSLAVKENVVKEGKSEAYDKSNSVKEMKDHPPASADSMTATKNVAGNNRRDENTVAVARPADVMRSAIGNDKLNSNLNSSSNSNSNSSFRNNDNTKGSERPVEDLGVEQMKSIANLDSSREGQTLITVNDPAVIKRDSVLAATPSLSENSVAEKKAKSQPEIPSYVIIGEPTVAQVQEKRKTSTSENWWASVGGAAGSYDPNTTSRSNYPLYNTAPTGYNGTSGQSTNRTGVGTSFSYGMNVGKKIAPRWMIMSGLQFISQSINYNSNVATFSQGSSQAYAADYYSATSATAITTPYTLNSVNEFISVPFQAGYLIIDRKVGLQLNTGVTTDFFVRNTVVDRSGRLSSYSQSAGDQSLYRTISWAGQFGTEVSYKVATHYRISLIPGLRYSFNSVLKSNTSSTLNPMVLDLGFRFRYMF